MLYLKLIWIALFFASVTFAFDLGTSLIPPSKQKTLLRYWGNFQPSSKVGSLQNDFSASLPILKKEQDAISISLRYGLLDFYPDHSAPVPELFDIQFGASYTHQIREKKQWSLSGNFGSSSDKPFKDSSVNTISASAFYLFPGSESGNWLLLLNYSNNRPFLNNIPLPGFAYFYAPSKTFRATLGVPFASLNWEFVEKWSLNLMTVAPWVAKAQVSHSIFGPLQIFSGVAFSQMTYLKHGRLNPKERLYIDEKKVFVGVKSPLSLVYFAEIETGYSFSRRLFSAEKYTRNPIDPFELQPAWFGKLSISAAF